MVMVLGAKGKARPPMWAGAAGVRPRQSALSLAARLSRRVTQIHLQHEIGEVEEQVCGKSTQGERNPLLGQSRKTQDGFRGFCFRRCPESERSEEDSFVLSHEIRAQQLL